MYTFSLNVAKSNFVIFHPYNKHIKCNIAIKEAMEERNYIKYLGVPIDLMLSWNDHILNLTKRIRVLNFVCIKFRNFANLAYNSQN